MITPFLIVYLIGYFNNIFKTWITHQTQETKTDINILNCPTEKDFHFRGFFLRIFVFMKNPKHPNIQLRRMSQNRSGARCEAGPAGDEATLHQSNYQQN